MREWIADHTVRSDFFWIMVLVLMFFTLVFGTMSIGYLLDPSSVTETCSYKYANTPLAEVPAGCINSRGGLR